MDGETTQTSRSRPWLWFASGLGAGCLISMVLGVIGLSVTGVGFYYLVRQLPEVQIVQTQPIRVGASIEGCLVEGDAHDWLVVGERGEVIEVYVDPVDGSDPFLTILDPDGDELDWDDDSGGELGAWIDFEVPEDGRYTLRVGAWGGGPYEIVVSGEDSRVQSGPAHPGR